MKVRIEDIDLEDAQELEWEEKSRRKTEKRRFDDGTGNGKRKSGKRKPVKKERKQWKKF